MKLLRSVVGVARLECVRNEVIRERLKQEAVVAQVKRRRDMWREKMTENEGSLVNRVMNGKVAGETQREAQKKMER